jgi:hypothetical protein
LPKESRRKLIANPIANTKTGQRNTSKYAGDGNFAVDILNT